MTPAQHARARRPMQRSSPIPAQGSSSALVMPFDHAATFELKGTPGNIVQDVINISSDGAFVAVAIGYGFEEERGRPADLSTPPASPTNDFLPGDVKLFQIPIAALIEGFRLNPKFERLTLADQVNNGRSTGSREGTFSTVRIPNTFVDNIIAVSYTHLRAHET